MHGYTEEGKKRETVIFWLAVISIILGIGITYGINTLFKVLKFLEAVDMISLLTSVLFGVSASGIFSLIYLLFDRFLWKMKMFHNHNLSGVYVCHGISKDKTQKEKNKFEATVTIKQTWTKIAIKLETELSYSDSFMARITDNGIGNIQLDYSYMNVTKQTNKDMASRHTGTVNLIFGKQICGKYYNQPDDRMRYGELVLIKREEKHGI